jgi:hypothetical protein
LLPSRERVETYLRPRARLVAGALAAGAVVGGLAFAAVTVQSGSARAASRQAFSVGTLVFGFGLLGWSGSAMVGGTVEAVLQRVDADSDWTEADSRRAMARIGGFGAGVMLGVTLGSLVVGV